MKKSIKSVLAKSLAVAMAFSLAGIAPTSDAASKKPALTKKVTVTVGKTKTVKVSCKKKVKKTIWSLTKKGKKVVSLSKKKAKSVVVKGKKKGTATLTAKIKVGSKTYKKTCKITVKKAPTVTAKPTAKVATPTPANNNGVNNNGGSNATPTPKATEKPVDTIKTENGTLTVDESATYNVTLTALNETTFTCMDKRPEGGDEVAGGTVYNRDGSVSFTSLAEYNSGVSYYINPCTSEDDVVDISDTRGEGFLGYKNGTKDMFEYDYIRIKVTSPNEMNCRTYNGNDQLLTAGFPGSSSSETYEGGWIQTVDEDIWSEDKAYSVGNTVQDKYQTRTVFIPITALMDKGMNPSTLTAIAFCPQSDGVDVTIHRVDFVKVKYDKKVTGIEVSSNKKELAEGKVAQCTAAITPKDASRQIVTWSSSDESLATVNFAGQVVAGSGTGTVTITATATDGSGVTGSTTISINPETGEEDVLPLKNVKLPLNAEGVVGKTNPGSGDSVAATQTATGIEFMADKNMTFVDFSAYLTANSLDLTDYASVEVSYKVVDVDGNTVTTNPSAGYGKVALVPSAKLNGYDGGINQWLNSDAERCAGTATISLEGKTAEEIAAIAGFNFQLGGVPTGAHMEVTGIKLCVDYNVKADIADANIVGKTNPGSGDSIAATQTAAGLEFMVGKNMTFVDFSAYLTAKNIDLTDYNGVAVSYKVVGSDGNTVTTNPSAGYGKVALVPSAKLNGYDGGINQWLNSDAERCAGTAEISFAGKTTEEIAAIAGFNFQLGGVPEGAHMEVTGIKFLKNYDATITLNAEGVVGKTNPGSGDSVAATQTATSIEFMADKNMTFVDFSAYLTANNIDLTNYNAVAVSYKVVDAEGTTVETNPNAGYGKVALVASAKLNGYDGGINQWLNSDADRCSGTATISLEGKTAEEIATIAGFNFQLGGVPEGAHMEVTEIKLIYNN